MAMMPFSSGINDVDRQTLRAASTIGTSGSGGAETSTHLATGLVKSLVIEIDVTGVGSGASNLILKVETALDAAATNWVTVPTQSISSGVVTPSDFQYTVATIAARSYLTYISGATLGLFTRVTVEATWTTTSPTVAVYALRKQVA